MSYCDFSLDSLKLFCAERFMQVSGEKADVIARLEDDNERWLQVPYDSWPNAILDQNLKLRHLKVSGTKAEKARRLERDDEAADEEDESHEDEDTPDDLDTEIGDSNDAVSTAIKVNKGEVFRNIFGTSKDRVTEKSKDIIKKLGRTTCVFCRRRVSRLGLNHVVRLSEHARQTDDYLLAPGCARCNKSYADLRVHTDAVFVRPGNRKVLERKAFYVMIFANKEL
jgi:hypothetical protein